MKFNAFNMKTALEIAKEVSPEMQEAVWQAHLSLLDPFYREIVEYITKDESKSAPCPPDEDCSKCMFDVICAVKNKPICDWLIFRK